MNTQKKQIILSGIKKAINNELNNNQYTWENDVPIKYQIVDKVLIKDRFFSAQLIHLENLEKLDDPTILFLSYWCIELNMITDNVSKIIEALKLYLDLYNDFDNKIKDKQRNIRAKIMVLSKLRSIFYKYLRHNNIMKKEHENIDTYLKQIEQVLYQKIKKIDNKMIGGKILNEFREYYQEIKDRI